MAETPPAKPRAGFARRCFRVLRLLVWSLLLLVLGSVIYLNRVGLPDFLRLRLLNELRGRGIDLRAERLRWVWYRGLVANGVAFQLPQGSYSATASAGEIAILPELGPLFRGQVDIRRVTLREGTVRLTVPPATNEAPLELCVTNINATLELQLNGSIELSQFVGQAGGAHFDLSGTLANAGALMEIPSRSNAASGVPSSPGEFLRAYLDVWNSVHFFGPPRLVMQVRADAKNWRRTRGVLNISAPAADTPWGSITNFQLTGRLEPARHQTALPFGSLELTADAAHTPWAQARKVRLQLEAPPGERDASSFSASARVEAASAVTRWGRAASARGRLHWTQSLTNPVPLLASGELALVAADTPWATAATATLHGRFWQTDFATQPALGFWTNATPYGGEWWIEATDAAAHGVQASYVNVAGGWSPPALGITNFHAVLLGGDLTASADLNVVTRAAEVRWISNIDALALKRLLPADASNWVGRIAYEGQPEIVAGARATFPPWTNPPARFGGEILPTLQAEGSFRTGKGSYLGMAVSAARGEITFSNQVLRIPALHAVREDGFADLQHFADQVTGAVYWKVQSTLDPNLARPVLGADVGRALEEFQFSTPPTTDLQLWLDGPTGALLGLSGTVSVSNVVVRGEPATFLRLGADLTNNVLRLFAPEVHFSNGHVRADGLTLAFTPMLLHLTNVFCDTHPKRILRAIGDTNLIAILADYQFLQPPRLTLSGDIPLEGGKGFDLRARIDGGPFHWWRATLPEIHGDLRYLGDSLEIRGLDAVFYGGHLAFEADFDFTRRGAAGYRFSAIGTKVNLQDIMQELAGNTNHVQGALDLRLAVTNATTRSLNTWNGDGALQLRDGLLWEQPVFSGLSSFINAFIPGLGTVRFRSSTATFTLTNGVFHATDLRFDSSLLRLDARGSINMEKQFDLLVQAKVLQRAEILGPLLNTLFWPVSKALEFRVTGTSAKPVVEPAHDPAKLLFAPLRPIRTIKSFFGSGRRDDPVYQSLEDLLEPPEPPGPSPAPQK